jgi:ubiquinone/menaquinone biosynthesis C-methylase UbiE
VSTIDDIRRYWDADAETYDNAGQHRPTDPAVMAAWTAAMEAALGPPPSRVLDCGAGTGFLTLIAAQLGHEVTALDLSPAMLERLRAKAAAEGLVVHTVEGAATEAPSGPFHAVMERHLLWTLPDPIAALRAWRSAAPEGRLVLVESLWGDADPLAQLRSVARGVLRRLRHAPPEHHAPYDAALQRSLPLASGTHPAALVDLACAAGWRSPRLQRLRDVEWAERLASGVPERLLGATPRFVLTAC